MAINSKSSEIFDLLLKQPGIDVNTKLIHKEICDSPFGDNTCFSEEINPLVIAIKSMNSEIIEKLIKISEIDLNVKLQCYVIHKYIHDYKKFYGFGKRKYKQYENTALINAARINNDDNNILLSILSSEKVDFNLAVMMSKVIKSDSMVYSKKLENSVLDILINFKKYSRNADCACRYIGFVLNKKDFNVNIKHMNLIDGKNIRNNKMKSEHIESNFLHKAVHYGNLQVIKILLSKPDIDVNVLEIIKHGNKVNEMTALHIAVNESKLEIVKLLIDNPHIDIKIKNSNGELAVDLAKDETIKQLLSQK